MYPTYRILYDLTINNDKNGYKTEDVKSGTQGLSDDLIIVSILNSSSGDSAYAFMSFDGCEGRKLSDVSLFKAWLMAGMKLSESE